MLSGAYKKFYDEISKHINKERIFTDPLRTLAYGTDASFYRLIPKIVIWADSGDETQFIIKTASDLSLSIVFRAAGTSLSAQAITDSILVVTSRDWNDIKISDDKKSITLSPSVIGKNANEALKAYEKKIGPDPASINSAMIGGIVANNASGMCCGTSDNSYKTIQDIKIILHDGSRLDTSSQKSKDEFEKTHKDMINQLKNLCQRALNNPELKAKITKKFQIKNTCGYGINSLIDYEDIYEVIKHLMVGSEGTLGFIEEVTLKTIEDYKNKASALLIFKSIQDACEAVAKLKEVCKDEIDAAELMDRRSLRSVENMKSMPPYLSSLSEDATALLVESRAKDEKSLEQNIAKILNTISQYDCEITPEFTTDEATYTSYWNIRKGLFPAVGGVRKAGTSVIIEDVAYPMESFASGILELKKLLIKHGYEEAIIFGHALDSNVHFVFTQMFETDEQIKKYDNFMQELSLNVAKDYGGSLKAEHGTGRNMAPFVSLEWGDEAYDMMKEIKKIFDPQNILNPGVIINEDPKSHLLNLKILPKVNSLIDMCIECGFCENVCPSNMLSLTPRQRIVANRNLNTDIKKSYKYYGDQTCATCSLCQSSCPVSIDMGAMTKYLREQEKSPISLKLAAFYSSNYNLLLSIGRFSLKALYAITHINENFSKKFAQKAHKFCDKIPLWSSAMPSGGSILDQSDKIQSQDKVVYFSSCINQTFANPYPDKNEQSLHQSIKNILKKANYELITPDTKGLCCGMSFFSKGFKTQGNEQSKKLEKSLLKASQNGKFPILCDMSPCTKTMLLHLDKSLVIYDSAEFVMEFLQDKLKFSKINQSVIIHQTCSTKTMQKEHHLVNLAQKCSTNVIIPQNITCCGFAGDRGFSFPELNKSALRNLKKQIPNDAKFAFSTSKTCEIGLSEHSGLPYRSIIYLVDKCTHSL